MVIKVEIVNETELRPKGSGFGYAFDLIFFIFTFGIWLVLFITSLYEILVGENTTDAYFGFLVLFIIPMATLAAYARIGEYVIISGYGISKPMKFKRRKIKFIPFEDIQYYIKVYTPYGPDMVHGLIIVTRANKKVKNLDRKTPRASRTIIRYLEEKGIREKVLERKVYG